MRVTKQILITHAERLFETLRDNGISSLEATLKADIIISAVGEPGIIRSDMVKEGAVVVDAGFSLLDGRVVGDVDFGAVRNKVSLITPVPGGVGPVAVAMLFSNIVTLYKNKNE